MNGIYKIHSNGEYVDLSRVLSISDVYTDNNAWGCCYSFHVYYQLRNDPQKIYLPTDENYEIEDLEYITPIYNNLIKAWKDHKGDNNGQANT
tara:strand:+ start:100 stop:375 length:276 start_codon:yes stop_codon:yes gene_type:complete